MSPVTEQLSMRNPRAVLHWPDPAEARQFVESTGVDILAPAVGTMHVMLKSIVRGEMKKHLDIGRIAEIKSATRTILTLHGGSRRFAIRPVEIHKIQPVFEAA